ncbi:LysR substrate-binding domain-containing protein [Bordetella sp. BOR01]|uniref:LysR substrate-binding domain-containing protein n=1 Tax=Bordetella sp. BOR01 TaxID=2854779 RepID=UPI001C45D7CA|nr:LysR substrate-binding domain-containing protein [Bordetella sp. BOR01]MBV7483180.1 LysR family transcriptional regulator [Bordetella sp. BOR01]
MDPGNLPTELCCNSTIEGLMRRLDLTSLRLFVDACEASSISAAASRACIVPSAVSRRIQDLEKSVGVALLFRSPRGITPTAAGQTVLQHARAALTELQHMATSLQRFASGLQGTVRVVANISSIDQYLPEDLAAFAQSYPDVSIELEEKRGGEIFKCVEDGTADLGIGNDWYLGESAAISRLYREDSLVAIFPRSHLKARLAQVSFSDVLDQPLIGLHAESAYNAKLTQQATLIGRAINMKIRVNSYDAICRMVHAGLGVSLVLKQLADMHQDSLNISAVPLSEEWARKRILIAYRSDDTLSASARTLLDFLTGKTEIYGAAMGKS